MLIWATCWKFVQDQTQTGGSGEVGRCRLHSTTSPLDAVNVHTLYVHDVTIIIFLFGDLLFLMTSSQLSSHRRGRVKKNMTKTKTFFYYAHQNNGNMEISRISSKCREKKPKCWNTIRSDAVPSELCHLSISHYVSVHEWSQALEVDVFHFITNISYNLILSILIIFVQFLTWSSWPRFWFTNSLTQTLGFNIQLMGFKGQKSRIKLVFQS